MISTEDSHYTYAYSDYFKVLPQINNWDKDKNLTGNLLKQLEVFVEESRFRVKKQQPRLIKIKTMKQLDVGISKVEYQEEHF